MKYMFTSASQNSTMILNDIGDISNWDTSKVTNMEGLFFGCSFIELDLSGWDTSNVTNMWGTFKCCRSLVTLNLSGWDTSKVTNMNELFLHTASLKEIIGIEDFVIGSSTTTNNIFSGSALSPLPSWYSA